MAVTLETLALQIEVNHQQMVAGLGKAEREVDKFSKTSSRHLKRAAAAAAALSIALGTKLAIEAVRSADKMQQLEFRLRSSTGSMQGAEEAMNFLSETAARQNGLLTNMADGYVRLLPSVKSGALEMGEMREILSLVNDNMKAFGISAANSERVFFGLSQLLGSGVVTMENLKQVTEHLPGTLHAVAAAMDTNLEGLIDLVSTGKVTAEQIKGPLTEALAKNKGAAEAMGDTYDSAKIRLQNLFDQLSKGSGILDIATVAVDTITETLRGLNELVEDGQTAWAELNKQISEFGKSNEELAEERRKQAEMLMLANHTEALYARDRKKAAEEEAEAQKLINQAIEEKTKLLALQKELSPKLEDLEEQLMSESQLIIHSYEKDLELLRQFEEAKLTIHGGFDVARVELERQKYEQLKELRDKDAKERLQLESDVFSEIYNKQTQFSKRIEKLKQLEGASLVQGTISTLTTVTAETAKHSKKMFEIHKALSIADTVISTAAAVMKAYQELGPIAGSVAAAGITALGAAQIATIASQQFQGGSSGGGGGAVSSSVSSASTATGSSGGDDRGINIGISGVSRDSLFSGAQVGELIKAINEEIENGAVIKGVSVV